MMEKKICIFFILLFSQIIITAQSLEGEWKGTFTQNLTYSNIMYEIIINLKKINDNSYEGFSKTIKTGSKNKFDTSICIVKGDFTRNSGFYLKEIKMIKGYETTSGDPDNCLMDMDLSLHLSLLYRKKKKLMELSGYWTTRNQNGCGSGPINITKAE